MDQQNPSSSKSDRKTIEKNRRNQMKALYAKLNSLVPHEAPREMISLPDQIERAMNYLKNKESDLEKLKKKKSQLMESVGHSSGYSNGSTVVGGVKLPHIDIYVMGSALEVVIIAGHDRHFMFRETIRMIHEEGAEVVSASFSVLDDYIFHNIHFKIGESASDNEAGRISEKLKKFVCDVN